MTITEWTLFIVLLFTIGLGYSLFKYGGKGD